MKHTPVLLTESLTLLDPHQGETVLDVTLGLGGHALALCKQIGNKGQLIGVDADKRNLVQAQTVLQGRSVEFVHANFRDYVRECKDQFDIVFADLGLSSPHIEDKNRGFSFQLNGPLDMRFDKSTGESAAELLQKLSEKDLAAILREYGEVRSSYPIAHSIKQSLPLEHTLQLAQAIHAHPKDRKKVLSQVFQALRIVVNDELGALDDLLEHGPMLLKPSGRMGVISYHSLEDRKVKQRFKELSTAPRDAVTGADLAPASYRLLTKKAVQANVEEIAHNPRARSARLRVIMHI